MSSEFLIEKVVYICWANPGGEDGKEKILIEAPLSDDQLLIVKEGFRKIVEEAAGADSELNENMLLELLAARLGKKLSVD